MYILMGAFQMLDNFNMKEAKTPKRFGKIARLIQHSF